MIHLHGTERRIDSKVRWMRIAAVLCALFAAAGIGCGIHDANPAGGWLVPVFAGLVAATAFGLFWHVAIHSITVMVRTTMIVGLFVVGIVFTAIALGASAQAIATAISGKAAMSAELSAQVDEHSKALAEAYAEATSWRSIAEAAQVLSVGFKGRAEMEAGGNHGTGKGEGPKWSSLMEASKSFGNGAAALNALLVDAKEEQALGDVQLGLLRDAAVHGDQPAFIAAAGELGSIITKLNAVDPLPIVESTGMVTFSEKGIDLSAETAKWESEARQIVTERDLVEVPVFKPTSPAEATRAQVLGVALHGWILAGAIDIIPLFLLIVAFMLSKEVYMQEVIPTARLTAAGKNERDREALADQMHRNRDNVVPLPIAAE